MKPGVSADSTGDLSMSLATSVTVCTTSGEVRLPGIISMRGMAGAGLKKCIPTTHSGRLAADAIDVTESEDVFVASMVLGLLKALSELKISRFRVMSSGAASIIRG